MRAVITVIGKDMVGIVAKVSAICADMNVNIMEVTQSVLQDVFAMIMLIDISSMKTPLADLTDAMQKLGDEIGVKIHVMHESVFDSMHRV
ncbi:MAG: ACT domain-containing protein [Oscillospiraceae bacterium]